MGSLAVGKEPLSGLQLLSRGFLPAGFQGGAPLTQDPGVWHLGRLRGHTTIPSLLCWWGQSLRRGHKPATGWEACGGSGERSNRMGEVGTAVLRKCSLSKCSNCWPWGLCHTQRNTRARTTATGRPLRSLRLSASYQCHQSQLDCHHFPSLNAPLALGVSITEFPVTRPKC